jgi:hypothetical protein
MAATSRIVASARLFVAIRAPSPSIHNKALATKKSLLGADAVNGIFPLMIHRGVGDS